MNINDFFKNKPQWKRTTRYKNNVELTTKPYVNELVYSFGQIYLYLGLLDDFDDIYYIKVGIDGIIHYESCVGAIGVPIKDMILDDEQYKKIKNSFIKNIKRQCEWRKSWDKRVYLPENTDTMQVEYFTALQTKSLSLMQSRISVLSSLQASVCVVRTLSDGAYSKRLWMKPRLICRI